MSKEVVLKSYKYDIGVSEIEKHQSNGLDASWLTIKFTGNDFNIKLVNSLRRVISNNLPMYAFPSELINIDVNTTVAFNNDYMRLRLSQLPVLGVDPNIWFLSEKYWYKVNFADTTRLKHQNEKTIEFFINHHNNSANIVNVTTNDALVYIDGEQVKPYNKNYPILIIKLRPNDRFKCHMKASLGVGDRHAIWKGARNAFHEELEEKNGKSYLLTVEGNGQCSEYELLIRACKFLVKKLTDLKEDLEKKISSKQIIHEKVIHFRLEQEDHTMGEILNYEFQNHKDIIASGLSKPDHLIKAILIKVVAASDVKSPLNGMLESIDILIQKYSHIGKLIIDINNSESTKLSKKK